LQVWLKQLATPLFNWGSRQSVEDISLRDFVEACKPHVQNSSTSDWNAGGGLLDSYFAMLTAQVLSAPSPIAVRALDKLSNCCFAALFLT